MDMKNASQEQGDPAGAVPLLFLHGLLCDARVWSAQRDALAPAHPIVFADYRDARTIGEMAERALASAPARFALVGHSMGGRVALEICRIAPERVERLALLSTGVHLPRAGEAAKRHALLALGRSEGIEALVDRWLPPMVAPRRRTDAFLAPLRAMCIDVGLDRFESQIEALLARPEVASLLPRIACPTLVAVGREDEWSPVDQHRDIAAAIPAAELVVFEDCGHMAPVEAPDALTEALRRWLRRP